MTSTPDGRAHVTGPVALPPSEARLLARCGRVPRYRAGAAAVVEEPSLVTALGLIAVAALIAANAWFVAAEFAFVAAQRSRLADAAAGGDRAAERAMRVRSRLSFMLSGAQLGITVTSLLVGFIAEPTLGAAFDGLLGAFGMPEANRAATAIAIAFVVATGAQMVFGELAPKNLAIARPEPVARRVATGTLVFLRVFGPVIRIFDGSANRLLRALGIEPVEDLRRTISPEELAVIVGASEVAGELTPAQADLLDRALGFRDLDAGAVMVPWNRVTTITAGATGADLRQMLATTAHVRIPVVDERGEPIGVVHAKDLLSVPAASRDTTSVAALRRTVLEVPEQRDLPALLRELRSSGSPLAIVIDEHGGAAGIVTVEDLVEELVGDIEDEYDRAPESIRALGAGRWRVPGSARPDEVVRETGYELPEGDYETVAGLMMATLGRLPRAGDRVEVDGLTLRVVSLDGRTVGIATLEVRSAPPAADDAEGRRAT